MKKVYNSIYLLHLPEQGQALVTLLVFMIIAITITSAAVVIIITNATSGSKIIQGENAYYVSESGIENALLLLLRNPNYAGETLSVGNGTATVTVTGSNSKTILSAGQVGTFTRSIEVQTTYVNNILSITSWKEVF